MGEGGARKLELQPPSVGEGNPKVKTEPNSNALQPSQPRGGPGSWQDSRPEKVQSPSEESRIATGERSGPNRRRLPERVVARRSKRPSRRFLHSRSSRPLPAGMAPQSTRCL